MVSMIQRDRIIASGVLYAISGPLSGIAVLPKGFIFGVIHRSTTELINARVMYLDKISEALNERVMLYALEIIATYAALSFVQFPISFGAAVILTGINSLLHIILEKAITLLNDREGGAPPSTPRLQRETLVHWPEVQNGEPSPSRGVQD